MDALVGAVLAAGPASPLVTGSPRPCNTAAARGREDRAASSPVPHLREAAPGGPARLVPVAALALVAGLALAVRLWRLGAADLGQAEHHKLDAVAAWRGGDWIVDGEHPALLKLLVLGSTSVLGDTPLALRIPNALAGVAVVVLSALIARRLGGWVAAGATGLLLALGTVPVAIDRVGKEDTLMLALALGAVLAWMGAGGSTRRWAAVAALAGAAAAAKYEALPLLPALLVAGRLGWGPRPPGGARCAAAMAAAFAVAHLALNPLLLVPAQWAFIAGFTSSLVAGEPPPDGTLIPTQGFAAAGRLFDAKPVWYYALYLGLKSQPAWILLAAAGIAAALARRSAGDRLLLAWALGHLALISLVPFGFARYMAPALPALAILAGVAVGRALRGRDPRLVAAAGGALALALAVPLAGALPFPTLYVNAAGGGSQRALHWTPDDAVGNLGMHQAVTGLVRDGVPGRVAAADPTLVRHLSQGRLRAVTVEGMEPQPAALRAAGVRAVVVQPSELSLGNRALFEWLARAGRGTVVRRAGVDAVTVYRVGPSGAPLR